MVGEDASSLGPDGGWIASADAWIKLIDRGDPNRELLLDPVMLRLAGEVSGLRVLDVGCGEGRFSRLLSQRGVTTIAFDLIAGLVSTASQRAGRGGHYLQATAEAFPFTDASVDLVVSYLTLLDIPDFRATITEMARVLKPGGRVLVANFNFSSAALTPSPWQRDSTGHREFFRLDYYAEERSFVSGWGGVSIRNWHRPLSAYMQAFLGTGLVLRSYLEPVPEDDSLRQNEQLEDWFRVPIFDVMLWQKP